MFRRALMAAVFLPLAMPACIPYAVGTTARPVARDSTAIAMAFTVIPPVSAFDSSRGASYLSVDMESRRGLDSVSDVGLRIVSGAGLVMNYKRLVTRSDKPAQIAIMPGVGFVNAGQHAHFELTLLASRREVPRAVVNGRVEGSIFTPYGGVRVMQVAPLNRYAVHDDPTAGGFFGLRIGSAALGISPEIGIFYDRSALDVRRGNVVVVPSIVVHGHEFIRALRGLPGLPRITRWPMGARPLTCDDSLC